MNAKRRPREYLTAREVEKLVEGARLRGRYGRHDATLILVAHRHGLRASELCALRWDQVDLERGLMHVRRLKNGTPSAHLMGLRGDDAHRRISARPIRSRRRQ
ncbi:MAG: tyrosine-type recombinase/integrase [Beijerinckiaceae bacterium]